MPSAIDNGGLPLLSGGVPFFDSERYLGACIESLLAQEEVGGPYEVILVDNGSTDGSAAIAARYRELDVLQEPRPGAYAARNTGIRAARAPVIALTDADCVVSTDWLRSILAGMRDPDVAILLGQVRYPASASAALRLLGAWENAKAEYVLEACPPAHRFAYANNMAVRSWVFSELGPFAEWPRAADSELVHRLASRRPEARTAYRPSMRVTHLEFTSARARTRRLRLYTSTNARIEGFRELGLRRRLGVLLRMVRPAAGPPGRS